MPTLRDLLLDALELAVLATFCAAVFAISIGFGA